MILILLFKYSNSQFGLVVYDSNFAILQFWFWSSGFFDFTVPFDSFKILVILILLFWFYDSNYSNSWFQFYGFTIQISRFCGSAFSISRFNFFKFVVLIWWFMILITWFYNSSFHDLVFPIFRVHSSNLVVFYSGNSNFTVSILQFRFEFTVWIWWFYYSDFTIL